jgi:hypothetical protein
MVAAHLQTHIIYYARWASSRVWRFLKADSRNRLDESPWIRYRQVRGSESAVMIFWSILRAGGRARGLAECDGIFEGCRGPVGSGSAIGRVDRALWCPVVDGGAARYSE